METPAPDVSATRSSSLSDGDSRLSIHGMEQESTIAVDKKFVSFSLIDCAFILFILLAHFRLHFKFTG